MGYTSKQIVKALEPEARCVQLKSGDWIVVKVLGSGWRTRGAWNDAANSLKKERPNAYAEAARHIPEG